MVLRCWRGRGNACVSWARVAGGSTLLNFLPPSQQGKPGSGDPAFFSETLQGYGPAQVLEASFSTPT